MQSCGPHRRLVPARRTGRILRLSLVLGAAAIMGTVVSAQTFAPIAGISSSTEAQDLFPAELLIQGPGIGFGPVEPFEKLVGGARGEAQGSWETSSPGGFPSDYFEEADEPVLILDLGQDTALEEISIWGYDGASAHGVSAFSLRFATESDGPEGFGTSIAFQADFEDLTNDVARRSLPFGETVVARYVEFTCVDNFFMEPGDGSGGEVPGGDQVGLGEIAFEIETDVVLEDIEFEEIFSITSSTVIDDFYPVENLIQGPDVGFDEVSPHTKLLTGPEGNWVTAAPGGFPSDYIEVAGMPVLIIDMGDDLPLDAISVWGYAASNANGVSAFSLRFATDADGPDAFGDSIDFQPLFEGLTNDEFNRQNFPFGRVVEARYIEFTCVDNFFDPPGTVDNESGVPGGDRVGLGEIAFPVASIEPAQNFLRGDTDANGSIEINDPVSSLTFQFLGTFIPVCLDALDFDDSGTVEITDPVGTLGNQFLGGPPPAPPGNMVCGPDPTEDSLDCATFPVCE